MNINGLTYYIEEHGVGEPLVLLHGFTGSTESWADITPPLSQFFRVILIDLPGHGRTETPASPERCTLPAVAEDLRAILTMRRAGPSHLLGYSMGGRLALYTALRHPKLFFSLIVESGSPGLQTAAERVARLASDNALADRIERDGIAAFVTEWEDLPLWESQRRLFLDTRLSLRDQRLRNNPRSLATSLRGMGTGAQPSLWEELPRLVVPTLLITGELDAKFTQIAHAMQARCPACEVRTIASAGHTPHLEQTEAYIGQVLNFLLSW